MQDQMKKLMIECKYEENGVDIREVIHHSFRLYIERKLIKIAEKWTFSS